MSILKQLMSQESVVPIENVELVAAPWNWPFAEEKRVDIDRYFVSLCQSNPALWNGRVLLLRDFGLNASTLHGTVFETDYASLQAGIDWQEMGAVKASFGAAALLTSDGAYVVGVMAPHTRNAGQIYLPSGSLEPSDLVGTSVDLRGNLNRELIEETGLSTDEFDEQEGWHAAFVGPRVAIVKIFRTKESGEELRRRILANLAKQDAPEFSDIRLVYASSELSPVTPPWLRAFFSYVWR
jgi:8-oxo-dGTP pyrophosphatase MutT (NUDIX family)